MISDFLYIFDEELNFEIWDPVGPTRVKFDLRGLFYAKTLLNLVLDKNWCTL